MKCASELGVKPVFRLDSRQKRLLGRFTASELTEAMHRIGAEDIPDFFAKIRFRKKWQEGHC